MPPGTVFRIFARHARAEVATWGLYLARNAAICPALLATAHRGQHEDRRVVRYRRLETIHEANVLIVQENVDVAPHRTALVDDVVERTRRFAPCLTQRLGDRSARRLDSHQRIRIC